MIVHFDLETRATVDIRKTGAGPYLRHPDTSVLCMASAVDSGPVELWVPGEPLPAWTRSTTATLVAHNAAFERNAWNAILAPRHGFAPASLDRWICTAAMAAARALPRSLADAAEALGLPVKKDLEGRRVMLKLSKPRKPTKNDPREWFDDPADFEILYEYCKRDVEVERLIYERLVALPPAEQAVYLLDQKINDRGYPIDLELVDAAIEVESSFAERLTAELERLTGGYVTSAKQRDRLLLWLQGHGLAIDDIRATTIADLLKRDDIPRDSCLYQVLEVRRMLGRSSTAKFAAMRDKADTDGRVRDCHLYCGASTGRWAGRGVQTQNMPRGTLSGESLELAIAAIKTRDYSYLVNIFKDVVGTLASCVRPAIAAPAGYRFIVSDFAGIEARVVAWLADEFDLLELFRTGSDVYKELASRIYHVPVDRVTKDQRLIGKIATLGLGYGMGVNKFRSTVASYGVEIDETFAQKVVDTYRETNTAIVNFWYRLGDAAVETVKTGERHEVGRVAYDLSYADELVCVLPSGREIVYQQPEIVSEYYTTRSGESRLGENVSYMTLNSVTHKWSRERSYGGKLVENVTQAVARDFLVDAMQRLEYFGYRIIGHVHDEVIIEVPVGFGSVADVENLMRTLPTWGNGCPIDVEGFECFRYQKG